MLQRKWLAMSILSVALVSVGGGPEAQATSLPPPPPVSFPVAKLVVPSNFQCVASFSSRSVTVNVCADTPGECPVPTYCTGTSGPLCSKWTYDFVWSSGLTPDDAIVSVSTNVDLYSATSSPVTPVSIENPANRGDNETLLGAGIWEQRTVRFDGHVSPLRATIITSPSSPIPGTVAGTGRIGYFPWFSTCMIQVPGDPGQAQAVNASGPPQQFTDKDGHTYCQLPAPNGCGPLVDCTTGVPLATQALSSVINVGANPATSIATPGSTSCLYITDSVPGSSTYVCNPITGRCSKVPGT